MIGSALAPEKSPLISSKVIFFALSVQLTLMLRPLLDNLLAIPLSELVPVPAVVGVCELSPINITEVTVAGALVIVLYVKPRLNNLESAGVISII